MTRKKQLNHLLNTDLHNQQANQRHFMLPTACFCSLCETNSTVFSARCVASAVLAVKILFVRQMLCDKTNKPSVHILTPVEGSMPLVFWHQQWLPKITSLRTSLRKNANVITQGGLEAEFDKQNTKHVNSYAKWWMTVKGQQPVTDGSREKTLISPHQLQLDVTFHVSTHRIRLHFVSL